MRISNLRIVVTAILVAVFTSGCVSLSYSDLEALGVNCPSKDKCQGYRNHLTYTDRSCECDSNCTVYKDCCIDAIPSRETPSSIAAVRTDVNCLHYGSWDHTGVYVISKCNDSWSGSRKVREKCTGNEDFTDPLSSVPMTDVSLKETYRNLACAKCNYANLTSLTAFRLRLRCPGLEELSEEQIMANLTYNSQQQMWGAYKLNRFGNGTEFYGCDIIFDVPEYLNNSVRFCRSNLISTCAANWTRPVIARQCAKYVTAVYSNTDGYRNPHCAICNHETLDSISCSVGLNGRGRTSPYPIMVDINPWDGELVGKIRVTECPSGHVYDTFFKRCRRLVCALPGHFVVNGRCVKI